MSERTVEQITCCQFCGETGFDAEGVKWHLAHGHCEAFNSLPLRPCFASDNQPQENLAAVRRDAERWRLKTLELAQLLRGVLQLTRHSGGYIGQDGQFQKVLREAIADTEAMAAAVDALP